MARTDEHTRKFMEDVSGQSQPDASNVLDPLRTARLASKIMSNPKKALGKLLVSKATKELSKEPETKLASMGVLGIFGSLNDHYGRDWWGWEPETLWKTLVVDKIVDSISDPLKDAIPALQVLVASNSPFEDWHIFEKVAHALNLSQVNFAMLQPIEMDDAALAIKIMQRIRPQQAFDAEVLGYLGACAREAGMAYLPESMLPGVQPYLDALNFDMHLRDSVKNLWEKGGMLSAVMNEAESIQLSRLKEIEEYLKTGGF